MKTTISTSNENLNIVLTINVRDLLQASITAPERERGRPKKLSTSDERLFQILLKVGAGVEDICQTLGIARASYFRYKQKLSQ